MKDLHVNNLDINTLRGKVSFMINRFLGDIAIELIKKDLEKKGFNFNPTMAGNAEVYILMLINRGTVQLFPFGETELS